MTRDQFREFVTTVINADPTWDGEYSVMERTVDTIVEQWESDVADARIAGQDQGFTNGQQQQMYDAGARFD